MMVPVISLACKRGDGLSSDSTSDSISYSTGRLRVRNKITIKEHCSFSLSFGSLVLEPSGTIDFYSFQYFDRIRLPLIESCQRIEACFIFLSFYLIVEESRLSI